jgi:hypothetical protein
MNSRPPKVPIIVFTDKQRRESRCINGLHIQTFIPDPYWNGETPRGTLITFAGGDTVTVSEEFEDVMNAFMGDRQDG